MNSQATTDAGTTAASAGVRQARILWLFNGIGTSTSLLYWGQILPRLLDICPHSRFLCARPPTKPIPGTPHVVECVGSLRIPLGRRRNSYDRQYVLPSPAIISRIRQERPDVIVIKELVGFAVYVSLFRQLLGPTKVLALIEGDPYQGRTRQAPRLVRSIRRWVCRRIDLFLTSNDGGRRYLSEDLCVPADRIVVRPFLVSEPPPPAEQPACHALPDVVPGDQRLVFLYVGQLIRRKGILPLLNAIQNLPEAVRARMQLWLVGDGEQRESIQRLVQQLQLEHEVRFWGRQPYEDLPAFYQAADVFVMPTLDDYRALVGFEALTHGLPLLHSIHDGACQETVCDGENGFRFDPLDPSDTTEKLRWFVDHQDRLPAMAARSRQLGQNYSVPRAVAGLVEAIERVQRLGNWSLARG